MKTSKFNKSPTLSLTSPTNGKAKVSKSSPTREPPIWLQIVVEDIKELLLMTKEKLPLVPKPKVESWDDWKDNL